MPTEARPEDTVIDRFVSAYENGAWSDATIDRPDQHADGGIDAVVTRNLDSRTLAIEHTRIQPFVREKEDFASFKRTLLQIENDTNLPVPQQWIRLFVEVGVMHRHRTKGVQEAIVSAVHDWIRANRLSLPQGYSEHRCAVGEVSGTPPFEIRLATKVVPCGNEAGKLHVRRLQVEHTLPEVVKKALSDKLQKLLETKADKHVLLLERQHMNLLPESILDEIEKQKGSFPGLAQLDEIWIVETMIYETEGYLRFEHYNRGAVVSSFDFLGAQLFTRLENGREVVVHRLV